MAGTLFVVATPIGNLEDLSARAIRILKDVSVIAAEDTRRTGQLLQRFGLTTRTTSFHEHNSKSKAPSLIERLMRGDDVAVVSDAGTPGISDPGQHLVVLAHQAGIRVVPVPGPSAVTAAISVSGFGGSGYVFLGFPPSKGPKRADWFERLRKARGVAPVAVFYEAPHRLRQTLAEAESLVSPQRIFVARELTKVHEELVFGYTTERVGPEPRGEFVVAIMFGDTTETSAAQRELTAREAHDEFCVMTKNAGVKRRRAISTLAKKYGLTSRMAYELVEAGKPSGV